MNIVLHIKEGDAFVFQQVYESNYEKVYGYAFSKTRSEWMAEETTQITFIKLWQYRERLDEKLSISAQIFRIAKTTMIDLIRKQNHLAFAINSVENGETSAVNDITLSLDYKETNKKLMKAISEMPPVRRRVFEMSRLSNRSYREIAETLSISVKTVEKHVSQALKQLRPYLNSLLVWWIAIICLLKNGR